MIRLPRRQFLQQTVFAAGAAAMRFPVVAADGPAGPVASPGPGVRYAVRGPFKSNDLRERALLLN